MKLILGFLSFALLVCSASVFAEQPATSSGPEAGGPSSSAVSPQQLPEQPRPVMDKSFWIVNGVQAGMTWADFALTQHCIDNHRCVEGNPLMPDSIGGKVGVAAGESAYSFVMSYYGKKWGMRSWYLLPVFNMAAHSYGIGTSIRFF